ncbi:MAG TPA: M15 family metallopeptidase [Paenibacillus sp.]|jgi:D-alanyl-D-alanine carboxypeptidase
MKKRVFVVLFMLGLCYLLFKIEPFLQENVKIKSLRQSYNSGSSQHLSAQTMRKIHVEKSDMYQGNLLLVNKQFAVRQESVRTDIVNLFDHQNLMQGYGVLDNNIRLSEEVVQRFMDMVAAASKDGVKDFLISSGYRDFKQQNVLYEEMGSEYALPAGNSEHNLGLSLDVGSTQSKMSEAPEGRWIEKNAWKYGFVLRYPKDKIDITGIKYEPWHIRYVGLPHSVIMHERNYVLEEYLRYLQDERKISVKVKGKVYTISYYPASQTQTIEVPINRQHEISGDNTGGIIVTVYD